MVEANILHADLDAFFASVEQRDDPRLRGRPVIVGTGVVTASYEAPRPRRPLRDGRPPGPAAVPGGDRGPAPACRPTPRASAAVFEVFEHTTPLVEALSIDEAFLDVGGLRRTAGTPVDIARRLRHDVCDQVGLPITVGVAPTKFLAKVASGVAKPDGLLVVPPGGELAFLHPLPVWRLWGQARSPCPSWRPGGSPPWARWRRCARRALAAMLKDPRWAPPTAMALYATPLGAGPAPPALDPGSQHALGRAPTSPADIGAVVVGLVDRVARRMRARGGSAARSRCDCGSTTSPGPPARTPCPRRRRTSAILGWCGASWPARCR